MCAGSEWCVTPGLPEEGGAGAAVPGGAQAHQWLLTGLTHLTDHCLHPGREGPPEAGPGQGGDTHAGLHQTEEGQPEARQLCSGGPCQVLVIHNVLLCWKVTVSCSCIYLIMKLHQRCKTVFCFEFGRHWLFSTNIWTFGSLFHQAPSIYLEKIRANI